MLHSFTHREDRYQPALFWFSVFALGWTLLLLYAGAYTTSIQAGMVFLDWPLSNSSVMPEGWWDDQQMRAEHGHRLLGAKLGFLAIVMAFWCFFREARPAVRKLAYAFLGIVVAQGLLGGFRVLFDQLNTGAETNAAGYTFRVLHALGAEITLCMLAALAVVLSRRWRERQCGLNAPVSRPVQVWGLAAVALLLIQILLGALMRHAGAGLAISTFPLTESGGLLPAAWTTPVTLHWLHRAGAVVVTIVLLVFLEKIHANPATRRPLLGWNALVGALLLFQIFLGAATIWTHKNPVMASTHMLVGALLLASTWSLCLQTFRLPQSTEPVALKDFDSAPAHDGDRTPVSS